MALLKMLGFAPPTLCFSVTTASLAALSKSSQNHKIQIKATSTTWTQVNVSQIKLLALQIFLWRTH